MDQNKSGTVDGDGQDPWVVRREVPTGALCRTDDVDPIGVAIYPVVHIRVGAYMVLVEAALVEKFLPVLLGLVEVIRKLRKLLTLGGKKSELGIPYPTSRVYEFHKLPLGSSGRLLEAPLPGIPCLPLNTDPVYVRSAQRARKSNRTERTRRFLRKIIDSLTRGRDVSSGPRRQSHGSRFYWKFSTAQPCLLMSYRITSAYPLGWSLWVSARHAAAVGRSL